jgi:NAD(P)H-hydrate epimerase
VGVERAILPKPGPAALATAGSGDVLGGIIASLLAQKGGNVDDLPLVCALACEIHGLAGSIAAERFGSRGVMAGDIIDVLGIATDTIEEHCYYPEAVLADGE